MKQLLLLIALIISSLAAKALAPNSVYVGCNNGVAFVALTDGNGHVSAVGTANHPGCAGQNWVTRIERWVMASPPVPTDPNTENFLNQMNWSQLTNVEDPSTLELWLEEGYEAGNIAASHVDQADLTDEANRFFDSH